MLWRWFGLIEGRRWERLEVYELYKLAVSGVWYRIVGEGIRNWRFGGGEGIKEEKGGRLSWNLWHARYNVAGS